MPHFECGAFDHSATSPQRVGAHIPSCAAPHKVARANNDAEMLPWAGAPAVIAAWTATRLGWTFMAATLLVHY